jgi:hypothetical protein
MPLGLGYQFFLMICHLLLLILVPALCLVLESKLIQTNDAANPLRFGLWKRFCPCSNLLIVFQNFA